MRPPFAALVAGSLLLAACGVNFSPAPQGNDFFRSLTITGDDHAGSPMTAVVLVRQKYDEQLDVRCEIRKGKELYKPVGQDTVPRLANGNPKATPFPMNFAYDFTVEAPGTYKFECFTPRDEDNYIIKEFTVRPQGTPTPIEAATAEPSAP